MDHTSNIVDVRKSKTSEVLSDSKHLPTIEELGPYVSRLPPWLDRLWDYWARAVHFTFLQLPVPNSDVLSLVERLHHIDERLADEDPSSHDVYLVSRPTQSYNLQLYASFEHWSVYSQGHFYHLSAPLQPRQLHKASREVMEGVSNKPCLKHEDFSSPEATDYIKFKNNSRQSRPLIAYKVGQTDRPPEQLHSLAQGIIDGMPAYDLWSANCQHFSISMLDKILVRLGDRSAFLGTSIQIVEWDLLVNKTDPKAYKNIELGYWIHAPRPVKPPLVQKVKIECRYLFVERQRKLNAIERYIRPGFRESMRDIWGRDIRGSGGEIKEFMDDLKQKNWRDAWRGRPDTWARKIEKTKQEKRKPDGRTKRIQADLVWNEEEGCWKWRSELSWKNLAIGII